MDKQVVIRSADVAQAPEIASLIMEAMDHDCCRNFAGPDHTLDDFRDMMTRLVAMDDSQYSYLKRRADALGATSRQWMRKHGQASITSTRYA